MELKNIRKQIDKIDGELVTLLEKRMDLVSQVIAYKKKNGQAILDSKREGEVLDRIASQIKKPDYTATIVNIFRDIMAHSRTYQAQKLDNKHETSH